METEIEVTRMSDLGPRGRGGSRCPRAASTTTKRVFDPLYLSRLLLDPGQMWTLVPVQ